MRRLTQREICNGAGGGEDAEAEVLLAGEVLEGVDDVVAVGDLEDMRLERGRSVGVPGYDDRRLRSVLGAGRSATWPLGDFYAGAVPAAGAAEGSFVLQGHGVCRVENHGRRF